jgi:DHA1 family multidrug resistance protein-like MFS transporter
MTLGQVPARWALADLWRRFAWTGFIDTIHWLAPTAAGVFIGFGVLCIFLPCFNYLVDAYLPL